MPLSDLQEFENCRGRVTALPTVLRSICILVQTVMTSGAGNLISVGELQTVAAV